MKKKLSFLSMVLIAAITVTACKKELKVNEPGNLVPKTVTGDASIPAIDMNGARFHAETFGTPTDPMVVMLHGGPGADYRSMLNAKALANDGYFVIFYDQRGSGLSQREDKNRYSIQLMLDDLGAVISHYRNRRTRKYFCWAIPGEPCSLLLISTVTQPRSMVLSWLSPVDLPGIKRAIISNGQKT